MKASNQYYLCVPGQHNPILLDCAQIDPLILCAWSDCKYFDRVLEEVDKNIGSSNLCFYVTWDTENLPSYGSNVVAIVLGDERCKMPLYADKVLAVFKGYGTRLMLASNPFLNPSYYSFLCLLHYLQASLIRLPRILRYRLLNKSVNIFDIPIGCFNSIDRPLKNFSQRTLDISFIGGVGGETCSRKSIKYWLKTPKIIARKSLLDNLLKVQKAMKNLNIYSSVTPDAISHIANLDVQERYIEILRDTKICLIPRGTSLETFRLFEAMKYGCVLVADVLPNRWFYENAPIVKVKNWCELDRQLELLLDDPKAMYDLHQASLKWWNNKCAEEAVGQYISMQINSLLLNQGDGAFV
jgi:hypothetical protein